MVNQSEVSNIYLVRYKSYHTDPLLVDPHKLNIRRRFERGFKRAGIDRWLG